MYSNHERLWAVTLHNAGFTYRKIEEEMGVSRSYANMHVLRAERIRKQILETDRADRERIRDLTRELFFVSDSAVEKKNRGPYKLKGPLLDFLEEIVEFERQKRVDLGRSHKQSLRCAQIAQMARDRGYEISEGTIRRYMSTQLDERREAFIAQFYEAGRRFEFDYGVVRLKIAGKTGTYHIAVIACPASGVIFARLNEDEKIQTFIDCHVEFFEYMGGTFKEGVYDNLSHVVNHFHNTKKKQFNAEVVKLACYYGFGINTNNIASGNEKGSVERAVDIVRNKAFAPKYEFDSLADAQSHLIETIEKLNNPVSILFERMGLGPLPPKYDRERGRPRRVVDPQCRIKVAGAEYSVPEYLVGESVEVRLYTDDLEVFYKGEKILATEVIEEGATLWEIRHVVKTLQRKPGALAHSQVLKSHPLLKAVFDDLYRDNPRAFIDVLAKNIEQPDGRIALELIQKALDEKEREDAPIHYTKLLMHGKSDLRAFEGDE